MKVLAIMGSPRKGKNNDILLDYLLRGIRATHEGFEIEKLYAGDLALEPCTACDACTIIRGCVKNDMGNDLIPKFDEADIVILTSPMYFNSITAQLKLVIDRNQAIWSSKYIIKDSLINRNKKRVGFMICTGGAPDHPFGMEGVIPIMDIFFKSINTENKGYFFIGNVDEEPAYKNEEILQDVFEKGKSLGEFYF